MSTATSDAETNPISIDLGVSIAIVNTSATITAAGHITTTGDTTLDAGAMNTMAAIARAGGSLQGAGAAVTIGVENSTANSTVTGTGQVRAGGDLTVQANTVTNKALQTITTTGDDGNVGVGVAVAYMNDTTTAALNGPVSSGKDTLVQANEVKNGFSGTKFFFLPTLFTGVAVNTGVGNDDTGDLLLNMQGAATTYVLGQAQKLFGSTASSNSPSSGPAKDSTPSFQAAAAVAIDVEDNAATATIGANNAVKVGGNLIVDANMNNRPNVIASSGIAQPEGSGGGNSSEFNGSAAVAIGSYTNTATSNIGAGAAVDAAKKLSVTAEALNDFQFTYGVNVVQAIAKKPTYTTTDSGINSVTVNPGDIVEVESNDSGNGTVGHWYQYVGAGSLTSVNLSTQSFFNTSLWNDLGPGWEYRWGSGLKQLTTYLDNSFGADNNLFDTWTQATSNDNDKNSNSTAEIVVAGSVTYDALNQTANASIGTGAQINQDTDPAYRTGSQSVFVLATGTNSSVNAGGSVQVPGFSGSNSELQVGVNAPGAGVEAKQACVGAALVVVDYSDNVTATVNSGVNLYADSLDVDAETAVFNFTIMISGGSSDSFGFIGVLSLVNVNNTTLAQVAAGSTLDVGNGNVVETFAKPTSPPAFTTAAIQANALPGTAGTDASGDPTNTVAASTIVQAHDWLDLWDFVGGIMAGGNAGVGASVGVGTVNRDTEAFVGDRAGAAGNGSKASLTSGGPVIVDAKNNGQFVTGALAAAKIAANSNTSGNFGVGVSGNVSYNQDTDTTLAYLRDAKLSADGLSVNAANQTEFDAFSGSLALVLNSGASVGIAGSYTQNTLGGTTSAYLDNANVTLTGNLTIDAASQGPFYSLSASGSFVPGGQGIAIAGQVSDNNNGLTTLAEILDQSSVAAGSNNIALTATSNNKIFAIAGAVSYGGTAGIGAALATNSIGATAGAYIQGSNVTSAGSVGLNAADTNGEIFSITAGGAGSQTFALGGAVSLNQINDTNDAHISGGASIDAAGAVTLTSSDSPTIEALAGGLAGSGTAAIGAALATNNIDDTTRSYIDGASVAAASAALSATSNATIESLTVAGAGSGTFSLGGAVGLNSIGDVTEAYITDGSVVDVSGALTLIATDTPTITSAAGALDAAGTAAISAGVATNTIGDTVTVYVDGGSQAQAASVTATATENANIEAASMGLSGSGTVAVSGGVGVNQIHNTTDAHIAGGATVTATGNISFTAQDSSDNSSLTGQGAGSLVGIGGAVSYNVIADQVRAYVQSSTVVSNSGAVSIIAVLTATINTITVGLSGGFVGIAGSVAVNLLGSSVSAYIAASSVTARAAGAG